MEPFEFIVVALALCGVIAAFVGIRIVKAIDRVTEAVEFAGSGSGGGEVTTAEDLQRMDDLSEKLRKIDPVKGKTPSLKKRG